MQVGLAGRIALRVVAAGYALYVAIALAPNVLIDDAAITFRYAARIAAGHGFTYNDHEHVLGASNPLYTLILGLLHGLGADIQTAARVIGVICFVLAVLLVFDLAERLANPFAGLVAAGGLATEPHFRETALSGLETGLAIVLALLVVAALVRDRDTWAGVFLGLALWNKLDAGLLAVALAAAVLIVRRRFPLRIAVIAACIPLPWWIFSLAYFGSVIPQSLNAKLTHQLRKFDPLWVAKFFEGYHRWLWVAAAMPIVVLSGRLPPRQRVAVLCLAIWFALHGLVYSLIDLGDTYPWYLTALLPPAIVLGSASVFRLPALAGRIAFAGAAVSAVAAAAALIPVLRATHSQLAEGNPVTPFQAFDDDRRLAGAFVRRYSDPHEVVGTGFGWPAYEVPNPINDYSYLNSKRMLSPVAYVVTHGVPYSSGSPAPTSPPGMIPLATFNLASDVGPGFSWFTVFGTPNSRIARLGPRYVQVRLFELPAPRDYSRSLRATGVRRSGLDLVSPVHSGATFTVRNAHLPVHVVFTPITAAGGAWEVRAGARVVAGARVGSRLMLNVATAVARDRTEISFVARGRVTWKDLKIVIGRTPIDVRRVAGAKIARLWRTYNPE